MDLSRSAYLECTASKLWHRQRIVIELKQSTISNELACEINHSAQSVGDIKACATGITITGASAINLA